MGDSNCSTLLKGSADSASSAASCGPRGLGGCSDDGFGGFGSDMKVDTPVWTGFNPHAPFKTGWEHKCEPGMCSSDCRLPVSRSRALLLSLRTTGCSHSRQSSSHFLHCIVESL